MNGSALAAFFSRTDAELATDAAWPEAHDALLAALESGHVRAASRADDGTWAVTGTTGPTWIS